VPEIKKLYSYWKIPVLILFVGLIYLAMNLYSEHWISFVKGVLFFSDLTDEQQLMLIRKMSFYSVSVLSVLFLVIRNRMSNIALITLMIIYTLLVFPFSYVDDPTETF
jgi:hypothetical protein